MSLAEHVVESLKRGCTTTGPEQCVVNRSTSWGSTSLHVPSHAPPSRSVTAVERIREHGVRVDASSLEVVVSRVMRTRSSRGIENEK